jgi:hypothetical protein
MIRFWHVAAFLLLGTIWINQALAEGTRRGINMDVNRTGYHMMVVIDKQVSDIPDVTQQECDMHTIALKRLVPDAMVCCYHTPEQAAACGR